ncbi:MAG TPA: hypothetical protein VJJ53_00770 [Candidatus Nanoarchaeia archaeon]|nr:hypothetical protein [Candidatus Nanoarchaeia archaeon]
MSEIGLHQELVGKLSPELVNQSEANLQDLLRCEEVRNLRFLSKGLVRLLDITDNVFLDTNILLNGTFTFRDPTSWMRDYTNQSGEFNLYSVSRIHHAYETSTDIRIDMNELYEYLAEDILRGDLSLRIFDEALRCREVRLPFQVYREALRNYTLAKKQVAIEEGKVGFKHRYGKGTHINQKKRKGRQVKIRSERELAFMRSGKIDSDIVRGVKMNLGRLSGLLTFAELNDRVVRDSGIYPQKSGYGDHLVIDGALQYHGIIGIATQDGKFKEKIRWVIGERLSKRLYIPQVYLLTGFRDLETYDLLKITS